MSGNRSFFAELKRRNVLRAAVLYAGAVWAFGQGLSQFSPALGLPDYATRWFLIAAAIGFPFWIAFAWFYELTPGGIKRESNVAEDAPSRHSTARRLDLAIIGVLVIVVVLLMSGYFVRRNAPAQGNAAASASASIPAKSIAVLPFVNMSGDSANDYFSDGVTEEILNALAQIPNLKVAARTSAFAFKGKEEDLREVGETLGVATVLEGSVQKSGDEVRITAQLIDTRNGYHLWSEKYDRKLTSIFAVEDEISLAIADKLRVQLVGGSGQPLIRNATTDPQAHALYLQGIASIARRGPELKDAVLLLQQATARDPGYANAWAGLAQAYELLPWYDFGEWRSSLVDAERAAKRALALDPQSGEAHAALANVLRDRLDYAAADREYRKALALSPGSSEIHNQYAQLMVAVDASGEALRHERIAISLDPLAPNPRYFMGSELLSLRRYPEAMTEFSKVLEQTPDYVQAKFLLASANLFAGRYDDARKVARAAAMQAGQDPETVDALMQAYANPTLRNAALPRVAGLSRIGRQHGAFARAYWYGLLGAREQAILSLQRWVEHAPSGERFFGIIFLSKPAFDPIRDDPRFKAVLKKMGLPYVPRGEAAPAR